VASVWDRRRRRVDKNVTLSESLLLTCDPNKSHATPPPAPTPLNTLQPPQPHHIAGKQVLLLPPPLPPLLPPLLCEDAKQRQRQREASCTQASYGDLYVQDICWHRRPPKQVVSIGLSRQKRGTCTWPFFLHHADIAGQQRQQRRFGFQQSQSGFSPACIDCRLIFAISFVRRK